MAITLYTPSGKTRESLAVTEEGALLVSGAVGGGGGSGLTQAQTTAAVKAALETATTLDDLEALLTNTPDFTTDLVRDSAGVLFRIVRTDDSTASPAVTYETLDSPPVAFTPSGAPSTWTPFAGSSAVAATGNQVSGLFKYTVTGSAAVLDGYLGSDGGLYPTAADAIADPPTNTLTIGAGAGEISVVGLEQTSTASRIEVQGTLVNDDDVLEVDVSSIDAVTGVSFSIVVTGQGATDSVTLALEARVDAAAPWLSFDQNAETFQVIGNQSFPSIMSYPVHSYRLRLVSRAGAGTPSLDVRAYATIGGAGV